MEFKKCVLASSKYVAHVGTQFYENLYSPIKKHLRQNILSISESENALDIINTRFIEYNSCYENQPSTTDVLTEDNGKNVEDVFVNTGFDKQISDNTNKYSENNKIKCKIQKGINGYVLGGSDSPVKSEHIWNNNAQMLYTLNPNYTNMVRNKSSSHPFNNNENNFGIKKYAEEKFTLYDTRKSLERKLEPLETTLSSSDNLSKLLEDVKELMAKFRISSNTEKSNLDSQMLNSEGETENQSNFGIKKYPQENFKFNVNKNSLERKILGDENVLMAEFKSTSTPKKPNLDLEISNFDDKVENQNNLGIEKYAEENITLNHNSKSLKGKVDSLDDISFNSDSLSKLLEEVNVLVATLKSDSSLEQSNLKSQMLNFKSEIAQNDNKKIINYEFPKDNRPYNHQPNSSTSRLLDFLSGNNVGLSEPHKGTSTSSLNKIKENKLNTTTSTQETLYLTAPDGIAEQRKAIQKFTKYNSTLKPLNYILNYLSKVMDDLKEKDNEDNKEMGEKISVEKIDLVEKSEKGKEIIYLPRLEDKTRMHDGSLLSYLNKEGKENKKLGLTTKNKDSFDNLDFKPDANLLHDSTKVDNDDKNSSKSLDIDKTDNDNHDLESYCYFNVANGYRLTDMLDSTSFNDNECYFMYLNSFPREIIDHSNPYNIKNSDSTGFYNDVEGNSQNAADTQNQKKKDDKEGNKPVPNDSKNACKANVDDVGRSLSQDDQYCSALDEFHGSSDSLIEIPQAGALEIEETKDKDENRLNVDSFSLMDEHALIVQQETSPRIEKLANLTVRYARNFTENNYFLATATTKIIRNVIIKKLSQFNQRFVKNIDINIPETKTSIIVKDFAEETNSEYLKKLNHSDNTKFTGIFGMNEFLFDLYHVNFKPMKLGQFSDNNGVEVTTKLTNLTNLLDKEYNQSLTEYIEPSINSAKYVENIIKFKPLAIFEILTRSSLKPFYSQVSRLNEAEEKIKITELLKEDKFILPSKDYDTEMSPQEMNKLLSENLKQFYKLEQNITRSMLLNMAYLQQMQNSVNTYSHLHR